MVWSDLWMVWSNLWMVWSDLWMVWSDRIVAVIVQHLCAHLVVVM